MSDLPTTLTYFGSLPSVGQIFNKLALPLKEVHQLGDPFLADQSTAMAFTLSEFYEASVKYIAHAILGPSPPRGQANHPLQKAIMRWRMEDRFQTESEIRGALQGLLPAMVENTFNEARFTHQQWLNYVSGKRIIPFYEKYQELQLWQQNAMHHKGAAIKFKCAEDSIFEYCSPVRYAKVPISTVSLKDYADNMVGLSTEIVFDPKNALLAQNYATRNWREWRMIVDEEEVDVEATWLNFPLDLVQSVYIGALVGEKSVAHLKSHLARLNPKIHVYLARCRTNEYSLTFDKISDSVDDENVDPMS
jgi:hypothetical protein